MQAQTHSAQRVEVPLVRGTQSFVHTLSECWRRPSLTALEVLWRWAFGIPALLVLRYEALRILAGGAGGFCGAADRMTVTGSDGSSADPGARRWRCCCRRCCRWRVWLVPLLVVAWVVVSSVGRTVVLRRVDGRLHSAVGDADGAAGHCGWWRCWEALRCGSGAWNGSRRSTVTGPIAAGGEPNLVGYFALVIVATLGLFTLWAVVSWALVGRAVCWRCCGTGCGRKPGGGVSAGAAKVEAGGDQPGDGDCEDRADCAGDGVFGYAVAV